MLIYYAHPQSWYDTTSETKDLAFISAHFEGATVVNPNSNFFREKVEAAKWAKTSTMQPFLDFIAQEKPLVVFRRFYDGFIGAGIAKEILEGIAHGCGVLEIIGEDDGRYIDDQWLGLTSFEEVLSIEHTRDRIKRGVL